MRLACFILLWICSASVQADVYRDLFQASGWPQQRSNFSQALTKAAASYQIQLPPALYQKLVEASRQRFAPQAMEQRALEALYALSDPKPALHFFQTPLGRKVVVQEVRATGAELTLIQSQQFPLRQATQYRRSLVHSLAETLPITESALAVSAALASVFTDSANALLLGLLGADSANVLFNTQRPALLKQIEAHLEQTVLYVYRDLSDQELADFLAFTQSPAGRVYYQTALQVVRAAMHQ